MVAQINCCGMLIIFATIPNIYVLPIWSEFELVSATNMNATDSRPFLFDIRVKRFKRGVYKLQGTITVTAPLKDYTGEALLYYSATSNNHYAESPFRIKSGPMCDKVNSEYRKIFMNDMRNTTTMPVDDDPKADLCPLFEVKEYAINGYEYSRSVIPSLLAPGMYKGLWVTYKDQQTTSGLQVLFRLS